MKIYRIIGKVFPPLRKLKRFIDSRVLTWFYTCEGLSAGNESYVYKTKITHPFGVAIGKNGYFEEGTAIKFSPKPLDKSLIIGDRVFVGYGCEFSIAQRIEIGDDVLFAPGCRLIDHNHGTSILSIPINRQEDVAAAITIGNNVWVGTNAIILKGVTISDGAIVGAGAVVTKSIGPNEIWGGVPAKFISVRTS